MLFALRIIYGENAEFLNVKLGGVYNNHVAAKL
jgi:hypothetical protein